MTHAVFQRPSHRENNGVRIDRSPPSRNAGHFGPRLQAKLKVSQPYDPSELEADRVADSVLRMAAAPALTARTAAPDAISRKCAACEDEEAAVRAPSPSLEEREHEGSGIPLDLDRPPPPNPGNEEEEQLPLVQRYAATSTQTLPSAGAAAPAPMIPSGGRPLAPQTRAFFEPRFGFSFADVRIHDDSQAASSARAVNALAYTVGNDVVFGQGHYSPDSSAGRRLLAHELTHVVQQSPGRARVAAPAHVARQSAALRVTRAVDPIMIHRWVANGPVPADANTIVCDGSGGVRVHLGGTGNADQTRCLSTCMRRHEESHRADALAATPAVCTGSTEGSRVNASNTAEQRPSEVRASQAEIDCLNAARPSASATCCPLITARITQMEAYRDSFK